MIFRLMTEADLEDCTQAFVDIFNGEPWYDEWTFEGAKEYISDFYHTPKFLGILAIENDEFIGFVYGTIRNWWSGREFFINEMGVKKAFRQQGIGKRLLEELKKELADSGVENFVLLTDRETPAEVFYQKTGFKAVERLVFYSRNI
ncbi:N-acetyltransferase family protein [Streptococcus dentasini]